MVRIARWEVLVSLVCTLVVGVLIGSSVQAHTVAPRAVYQLRLGIEPMPYRLVLRNCSDTEDSWATIFTKRFDPEKVVLRCATP